MASSGALAQSNSSPSRVVPQSAAPVQMQSDGSVALPESRYSIAPAGAEAVSVRVERVDVAGGRPELANATAAIVDRLAGRTVTVAEIYQAAAQIEAVYARSGQILTRATVPEQRIVDGATVRIMIVEGFVEAIDASAVPNSLRSVVEQRASKLVGKRGLTLKQIERHLLLAGRVPGASLESTIVPGKELGGAVLVLKSGYKPVTTAFGIDNRLSGAYDNWNVDVQVVANSVLGAGEQLYALDSTATDFNLFGRTPLRRILGVGAIAPLGADGLTFNAEYLHADTNPKVPTGAVPVSGKLDKLALRFSYPLTLTRQESLNLKGAFEILNEGQRARGFNVELSQDRLRFLTLGLDWSKALSARSTVTADFGFAKGFDAFNARNQREATASGVNLSRQGSEPDFTKVNVEASYAARLGGQLQMSATGRGQVSLSGALPSAAMFSLDAIGGLSGFDLGSINVDSGATGRLELGYRIVQAELAFVPYVFGTAGAGTLSQPTALERKNISGWSFGAGVRGSLGRHVSVNAELSRNHANTPTPDTTRLMVGIDTRF